MKRVLIVGGGISGLSAAYFLSKRPGVAVTLVENSSRLGGTIETFRRDGFLMEAGPDSFLSEKPAAVELAAELGLSDELVDTREPYRKARVAKAEHCYEIPKGFYLIAPLDAGAFLRSPILSWRGKIRAMAEPFVPRRTAAADESVGSFIRRRFGRELLDRIGQPMVAGVYTGDPDQLSLQATFPKFSDLESRYGSVVRGMLIEKKKRGSTQAHSARGPRYGLFLSFREGMETLVKALASKLSQVSIHMARIESLIKDDKGQWTARLSNGACIQADAVCLAVPARVAAPILKDRDGGLASLLEKIRYESVATVNLAFGPGAFVREPDSAGLVVPAAENRSLVAATFAHLKYAGRAPEGRYLVRAYVGGAFGREHFEKPDSELAAAVLDDLSDLTGLRGEPLFYKIHRHPNAMVQYTVGHSEHIRQIEEAAKKHAGLFLTGSSYRGVGIPDCISQSKSTVDRISNYLEECCHA